MPRLLVVLAAPELSGHSPDLLAPFKNAADVKFGFVGRAGARTIEAPMEPRDVNPKFEISSTLRFNDEFPDDFIVERAVSGDASAREKLACATYPLVKVAVHGALAGAALNSHGNIGDDLVQAILQRIFSRPPNRLGTLREKTTRAYRGWVSKIVGNMVIDVVRSAEARRNLVTCGLDSPSGSQEGAKTLHEVLPDAGTSPAEKLLYWDNLATIAKACQDVLNEEDILLLQLRGAGLLPAEIARQVGSNANTVSIRLFRAKRAVLRHLAQFGF